MLWPLHVFNGCGRRCPGAGLAPCGGVGLLWPLHVFNGLREAVAAAAAACGDARHPSSSSHEAVRAAGTLCACGVSG